MRVAAVSSGLPLDAGMVKKGAASQGVTGPGQDFGSELADNLKQVNQLQTEADKAIEDGAVNGATNIHETMLRIEEADVSLRLMTKIRNKAVDAYQEIMRMQF